MNELTQVEMKYVVLAMLDALESVTGSKDDAWSAVMASHEEHVANAPDNIEELLNTTMLKMVVLITNEDYA